MNPIPAFATGFLPRIPAFPTMGTTGRKSDAL